MPQTLKITTRIWVNPLNYPNNTSPDAYSLSYTLDLASRFFKKGYKIYLDFHFSDTWADPQHQIPPAGWPTTVSGLATTLRSYVSSTLLSFHEAGITLSLVSLGNEIRHGMLWPYGQVDVDVFPVSARVANFSNLATLYSAARSGVSDAVSQGVPKPQVMIHIDNGWNITLQQAWFGALTATGEVSTSDWDVFGFSFYPFYDSNATLARLQNSLNTLATQYNKPIHVVETDWPESCPPEPQYNITQPVLSEPAIPVSVQGQIQWVHNIIRVVQGVPNGLGQGVNYWEPAWYV